jgi:phospholipid-translocating ATPase
MKDVEEKINEANLKGKRYRGGKREKSTMVCDFITCLAVCHNVTPSIDEGKKVYQASSPDEIALVKISESVGMELIERNVKEIIVRNPLGNREVFTVLQMFPFTSASKRMGIIVRHNATGRIIFYLKGADSVMAKKIYENLRSSVEDQCE